MGMLVYGDPRRRRPVHAVLTELLHLAGRAASAASPSADLLRVLLIRTGQLEQALMDTLPELTSDPCSWQPRIQSATDLAASAFHALWSEQSSPGHGAIPSAQNHHDIQERLEQLHEALRILHPLPEREVSLKTPEGFAFYALFPEQYCLAALRWIADYPEARREPVAVIGLRSIGTTLSAVVAATLAASGSMPIRLTLRPTGHPFARTASLAASELHGARHALVVDEGPGQSGSSLASVAEALCETGMPPERIHFFPGHGGLPGPSASEQARRWWAVITRHHVPSTSPLWEGHGLTDALARETTKWLGDSSKNDSSMTVEEIGGGRWRRTLIPDRRRWPAGSTPFERPQYRAVAVDGRAVRWKFAGFLEAAAAFELLQKRAAQGWTLAPLGHALGFVAQPWLEGTPLARADATPELLFHVGRYIAAVAGPALTVEEQKAALDRLREMAVWNTLQVLDGGPAAQLEIWSNAALKHAGASYGARYGDGRMAAHGWRRLPSGGVVKADAFDHTHDHTLIGKQSIEWDLAGALVEWRPTPTTASALLDGFRSGTGESLSAPFLTFHCLAYAAFRLGQCRMCVDLADDAEERRRLRRAIGDYVRTLHRLLSGGMEQTFGLHRGTGGPSGA